ncbi:hypothetical protein L195_g036417 [Trifolium pratense]|uniref:Uncharacterized protein n=1 Tax=Trifolium pratense TaxID=57577 RepID=A0A2K3LPF3_TRIPR|nr:hypothetical protein L195_g036417 [Trifolium pratense]
MKGSLFSVVLTLTALLVTSLFHHNNLFAAADSSWGSISPSSPMMNTDYQGANNCSGLHCLIDVANHETDLFMDQLKGSGNNIDVMNSMIPFKPIVSCKAHFGGSDCTPDVSPQYKKLRCDKTNRIYSPGCPK